jgi:hypothetical protein
LASHIEDSNSGTPNIKKTSCKRPPQEAAATTGLRLARKAATRWMRKRCYGSLTKIRSTLANYLAARPADRPLRSERIGSTQHGTNVSSYRGLDGLCLAAIILSLCGTTGCYNHQFQLQEPAIPPGIPVNPQEHYAELGVI